MKRRIKSRLKSFYNINNFINKDINIKNHIFQLFIKILPNANKADRYFSWSDTFFQALLASQYLFFNYKGKKLLNNLLKLMLIVNANHFNIKQIILFLKAIFSKKFYYVIRDKVYLVIMESMPFCSLLILPYSCLFFSLNVKKYQTFSTLWILKNVWACQKSE